MTRLRVLVACERSQVVQQAFVRLGHYACSLDIAPTYGPDPVHHMIADAYTVSLSGWDLIIAHPPCTVLSRVANGLRGSPGHEIKDIVRALRLWARFLFESPCPVAVENPVGIPNSILPPSQIIQPFDFGDPYRKETCLWLRGLPPLMRTAPVEPSRVQTWVGGGRTAGVACKVLGMRRQDRSMARAQTFPGIAAAMAMQWSAYLSARGSDALETCFIASNAGR